MTISYTDAKEPRWVNFANTRIVLQVDWDHVPDETYSPCCIWDANGQDGEEHIADLWNRTHAGDFGELPDFEIPADLTPEETLEQMEIRLIRNNLLLASDIAITNDRWQNMTDEQKQAWTVYRQALRDVPQNWTMTASYDTSTDSFRMPEGFSFPEAPR